MSIIFAFFLLLKISLCVPTENSTAMGFGKYSVSGFPASIIRYPSAVYLESIGTKCTGTLISKQYVLTAGHCVKKKIMLAYIGHSLKHCGRIHEISKSYRHPEYKRVEVNDIAVLKLRRPVKTNKLVKLLHMPNKNDVFPVGTRCLIAGWGRLSRLKKKLTNRLHYGMMEIVDPKNCEGSSNFDAKREICAGKLPNLKHITGKGDSGTALRCIRKSDGKLLLAGVDSRAPKTNLTIFTKVSFYRDWIDSKIYRFQNGGKKGRDKVFYKTFIYILP